MEIPIKHQKFEGINVSFLGPGLFSFAKITVDGRPIKGKKSVYLIKMTEGNTVEIKMKRSNIIDMIPQSCILMERLISLYDL